MNSIRAALFTLLLAFGGGLSPAAAQTNGTRAGPSEADKQFLEAEGLFGRKLHKEAVRAYDRFVKAHPKDSRVGEALWKAAEATLRTGSDRAAIPRFEKVAASALAKAYHDKANYRAGRLRYRTKGYKQAAPIFAKLSKRPGYEAKAGYFYGRSLFLAGDKKGAVAALSAKAVLADKAFGAAALWTLGEAGEALKSKPAQVAAHYEALILKFPSSRLAVEAGARAGRIRQAAGQTAEALKNFDWVLAKTTSGTHATAARYGRMTLLLKTGPQDDAMAEAKALAENVSAPSDVRAGALLALGLGVITSDPADAYKALNKAMSIGGNAGALARVKRMWPMLAMKKNSSVVESAQQILTSSLAKHPVIRPLLGEVRYLGGLAALRSNNEQTAVKLFQGNAAEKGPLGALSAYQLGLILFKTDPKQAAAAFDRIMTVNPDQALAEYALAQSAAAYLGFRPTYAAARAESLIKRFPQSPLMADARWNLAMASASDAKKMGRVLDELVKAHPKSEHVPSALYWSAWSAARRGDYLDATERLVRLLKEFPASPHNGDARVRLALLRYRQRKYPEAEALLDAQVEADAKLISEDLLLWLGFQHIAANRQAPAEKAMRALLSRDKSLDAGVRELTLLVWGELRVKQEDFKGAVESFDKLMKTFPKSAHLARARLGKGRALRQLKQFDAATTVLVNAKAERLLDAMVTFELGRVLQESAAAEAKQGHASAAVEKHAEGARYYMRVAILYASRTKKVSEVTRLCAASLFHAAECFAEVKEYAKAIDALEELHKYYRADPFAARAATAIETYRQKLPKTALPAAPAPAVKTKKSGRTTKVRKTKTKTK
jgi:TolA-binding protein